MNKLKLIRPDVEAGRPYYGLSEVISESELRVLREDAEEAVGIAHQRLQEDYLDGNPRVAIFGDPEKPERGTPYISFTDAEGRVCWGLADSEDLDSDEGFRGTRYDYPKPFNRASVLHTDLETFDRFRDRRAPTELLEALHATTMLTKYLVKHAVIPYLKQLAEEYSVDTETHLAHYFRKDTRSRLTQRVLVYPAGVPKDLGPPMLKDEEGVEQLIAPHPDKCVHTFDVVNPEQTGSELQYWIEGEWVTAGSGIVCFRGRENDLLLGGGKENLTPPVPHRAIYREGGKIPQKLQDIKAVRIAAPLFVKAFKE